MLAAFSCKKEINLVYQLDEVTLQQAEIEKNNVKTQLEFISIAYTDLFGTTISQHDLENMALAYDAFGDNKLMEDLIIRNLIVKNDNHIPETQDMRADPEGFVRDVYAGLFNREANEYELWYFTNLINEDTALTAELVYYSFLTADEYRTY
jgi:hypothetical protein